MAQPLPQSIREALLAEIESQRPGGRAHMPNLQQSSILDGVERKLGANSNPSLEEAILTQWGDLFRTGLLSWGLNISNPNPPFFHLTERGHQALQNLTRDPSNPAGYLRHLAASATIGAVALSYLTEGLECYVAGLFKAAAVMVGGAAERIILDVRDVVIQRLTSLGKSVPPKLEDWRIRIVSNELQVFFEERAPHFDTQLRESFEAYWSAFAQQIRAARNDSGHPTSIDPVTADTVHASLLIFPELAKLVDRLSLWVVKSIS
jgi:hypothetical protein